MISKAKLMGETRIPKSGERPRSAIVQYDNGLVMEYDGQDVFLSLHGQQIAKRGRPDTLYARQWIALEPGVVVHDGPGLRYFDVWINSVAVH